MAVRPEGQRQGIGSELVQAGLDRLRDQACP
jgi:predicted N-acetyltransferase YhbS